MSNNEPLYVQKLKKTYGDRQDKVANIILPSYLSKGASDNSYDKMALEDSLKYIPRDDIYWYPDGSLQIDGFLNFLLFWESGFHSSIMAESIEYPMKMGIVRRGKMTTEHHDVFSIIPWLETSIRIWNWDSSPQNWGHQIQFAPRGLLHTSCQSPQNNTPVHILFKKSIAKHHESFCSIIRSWVNSTSTLPGQSNSVPIILDDIIEFFPKVARFFVDFSSVSQISVNWLMMQLVQFSSVVPIQRVEFVPMSYSLTPLGLNKHQQNTLSFEEAWNFVDKKSVRISVLNNEHQ